MNSREKFTGNKEEFYFFLKNIATTLFNERLKIDGDSVLIPVNEELDYQIKFDCDENYGDFTIKVKWGEKAEVTDVPEEASKDDE